MLYYKFTIECSNVKEVYDRSDKSKSSSKINVDCQRLNEVQDYNVFFMVSKIEDNTITLCAAIGSKNTKDANELATGFATGLGFDVRSVEGNEILIRKFAQEARSAERYDFIDDEDEVLSCVSLGTIRRCMAFLQAVAAGGFNGIDIGSQEEEFPAVFVLLVFDHAADLFGRIDT